MLDKPGTLLVVRKIIRKNHTVLDTNKLNHGIFGVFEVDETKGGQINESGMWRGGYHGVDLPYGTPVILLGIKNQKDSWTGKKNLVRVYLLYGDTYIVGCMSQNQLNKWFCRADVWKKHYAGKSLESLSKQM